MKTKYKLEVTSIFLSKEKIFPSWIRPKNPERSSSLKAINLPKVRSGYSQFESRCTGAWHTHEHTKDLFFIRLILYSPASKKVPC